MRSIKICVTTRGRNGPNILGSLMPGQWGWNGRLNGCYKMRKDSKQVIKLRRKGGDPAL